MLRPPDPATSARPWVASYPPGVPPTYRLPTVRLPRLLDDAARDFPEHVSCRFERRQLTYTELRERVDALAAALTDLDRPDDDASLQQGRVLVRVPDGFAAPVILFALWRLGAVAVPVDPALDVDELLEVAKRAEVVGAIADPAAVRALTDAEVPLRFAVTVRGDEWDPARRRGPLGLVPRVRLPRPMRRRVAPSDEGPEQLVTAMADLLAGGDPRARRPRPALPHDGPALLAVRTGPDGVALTEHTHVGLLATAFQARLWIPDVQAGRERVLVAQPMHDLVGLAVGLLAAVLAGATTILLDTTDDGELGRTIERSGATLLVARSPRIARLMGSRDATHHDLSSLRVCLTVGDGLPPQLARKLEVAADGARVRALHGYGDAVPIGHGQPVYGRVVPSALGLPVTSTVAMVVRPDDLSRIVPPEQVGRLLLHGPQVAPAADGTVRTDGWVATDLLARMDADGWFTVVGRDGEVVDVGGEPRSPARIAAALVAHPAVRDVEVVAVDDELVAAVVRARRRHPAVEDLRADLAVALDDRAMPDELVVFDALPRDDDGHLDVAALEQRMRDTLHLDPDADPDADEPRDRPAAPRDVP